MQSSLFISFQLNSFQDWLTPDLSSLYLLDQDGFSVQGYTRSSDQWVPTLWSESLKWRAAGLSKNSSAQIIHLIDKVSTVFFHTYPHTRNAYTLDHTIILASISSTRFKYWPKFSAFKSAKNTLNIKATL